MNKYIIFYFLVLISYPGVVSAQSNEFRSNPEYSLLLDYDNTGSTIVSFHAGGKLFYGIAGMGYNWRATGDDAMIWQLGAGAHIGHGFLFNTDVEFRASLYTAFKSIQTTQYSISILPGIKVTNRIECYIGPDISYIQTSRSGNHNLLKKGITLWDRKSTSNNQHIFIGFITGIRYRF